METLTYTGAVGGLSPSPHTTPGAQRPGHGRTRGREDTTRSAHASAPPRPEIDRGFYLPPLLPLSKINKRTLWKG